MSLNASKVRFKWLVSGAGSRDVVKEIKNSVKRPEADVENVVDIRAETSGDMVEDMRGCVARVKQTLRRQNRAETR